MSNHLAQMFPVHQPISLGQAHQFGITAPAPIPRMLNHSRAHHVQFDIHHAFQQVFALVHRHGVKTSTPEGSATAFAQVVPLRKIS
ncbi:MAG: hypothetical protein KDL31_10665, partial [Kiritimatiellae bacterium]|nr:hypothetical protein [Kiritimatiellia bacterium]